MVQRNSYGTGRCNDAKGEEADPQEENNDASFVDSVDICRSLMVFFVRQRLVTCRGFAASVVVLCAR